MPSENELLVARLGRARVRRGVTEGTGERDQTLFKAVAPRSLQITSLTCSFRATLCVLRDIYWCLVPTT